MVTGGVENNSQLVGQEAISFAAHTTTRNINNDVGVVDNMSVGSNGSVGGGGGVGSTIGVDISLLDGGESGSRGPSFDMRPSSSFAFKQRFICESTFVYRKKKFLPFVFNKKWGKNFLQTNTKMTPEELQNILSNCNEIASQIIVPYLQRRKIYSFARTISLVVLSLLAIICAVLLIVFLNGQQPYILAMRISLPIAILVLAIMTILSISIICRCVVCRYRKGVFTDFEQSLKRYLEQENEKWEESNSLRLVLHYHLPNLEKFGSQYESTFRDLNLQHETAIKRAASFLGTDEWLIPRVCLFFLEERKVRKPSMYIK